MENQNQTTASASASAKTLFRNEKQTLRYSSYVPPGLVEKLDNFFLLEIPPEQLLARLEYPDDIFKAPEFHSSSRYYVTFAPFNLQRVLSAIFNSTYDPLYAEIFPAYKLLGSFREISCTTRTSSRVTYRFLYLSLLSASSDLGESPNLTFGISNGVMTDDF